LWFLALRLVTASRGVFLAPYAADVAFKYLCAAVEIVQRSSGERVEERVVSDILKSPQERLAAKEQRAQDAALAMQEHEAAKLAEQAKTARLRALRLAKEAADAAPRAQPKKQTKKLTKEAR
jgi:hypothetical protein